MSQEAAFGRYQLQERIAVGGMAEIFRARYTGAAGVTKSVVIKKILPTYAGNPSFVAMFIDEAKIAVGLSHGNIAQVFDFGEIDGEYFLAMEYVHGQPLSRLLKRAYASGFSALPPSFAVMIAMETCRGLHYAHTRVDDEGKPINLVHRDVSPPNVLVSYEGQVKIVDFGVAKSRNAGRTETEAGAVKGKYVYFAPEQARGKALDARTDVFACGVVLYEMVCGRQPFQGRMVEVLSRIVQGEFPPPRAVNPELPPELEKILLTAMAHDPADRYQTAEAFQQALAGYLHATAPGFSATSLSQLLRFLFEPELSAEGRATPLPPEFLAQVPAWKKAGPPPAPGDDKPTAVGKRPPASAAQASPPRPLPVRPAAPPVPPPAMQPPRRPPSEATFADPPPPPTPWLKILLPICAVMVALAAAVLFGRSGSFSVKLNSRPPGATVFIDGQKAPAVTPLLISELSTSGAHRLEVRLPGNQTWVREVSGKPDEVISLLAEEGGARSADAGTSPRAFTWPFGTVHLDGRAHAFVPQRVAKARLDPRSPTRAWVETPAGADVFYFLEGVAGAEPRWGLLGKQPVTLPLATSLQALVVAALPGASPVQVRLQAKGAPEPSTLRIDPSRHGLSLEPAHRLTLEGLSPEAVYQLEVKASGKPASALTRALCQQRPAPDAARVLEPGRIYRVQGTDFLWCAFPGDDPAHSEAGLDLTLTPVPR